MEIEDKPSCPDKFYFKFYAYTRYRLNLTRKEIFEELEKIWKNFPIYRTICNWATEFEEGKIKFEDKPKPGRPSIYLNS